MIKHLLYSMVGALLFLGCEDFIQIDPPKGELVRGLLFQDDATAQAAVRGIYSALADSPNAFASGFNSGITVLGGLSADELFTRITAVDNHLVFQHNNISSSNSLISANWDGIYRIIYNANSVLEGLAESQSLSFDVKRQLEGEAKFVRAFCYFYLVNLWGGVPLIRSTDYRQNMTAPRADIGDVNSLILDDLKSAQLMLYEDYDYNGGERTRPNRGAATALLARFYLYGQEWALAEQEAAKLIDTNATYSLEQDMNKVFLKNSNEAIWQLFPIIPTQDTYEGIVFLPTSAASSVTAFPLTNALASSFDADDLRATNWVKSKIVNGVEYYYPHKYRVRNISVGTEHTEYSMILRLAEVYLIRAEARVQQDNLIGAAADLDIIRSRAGLANTTAASKEELLLAIEQERQHELFSEWGHRWLDLVRTNRATAVLGAMKDSWQGEDSLWPIPQDELDLNKSLFQNPNY